MMLSKIPTHFTKAETANSQVMMKVSTSCRRTIMFWAFFNDPMIAIYNSCVSLQAKVAFLVSSLVEDLGTILCANLPFFKPYDTCLIG